MSVVAEFEDSQYFDKIYIERAMTCDKKPWYWGLGHDGLLYCKCEVFINTGNWVEFGRLCHVDSGWHISISDMKKIVKEFGHLLIWL